MVSGEIDPSLADTQPLRLRFRRSSTEITQAGIAKIDQQLALIWTLFQVDDESIGSLEPQDGEAGTAIPPQPEKQSPDNHERPVLTITQEMIEECIVKEGADTYSPYFWLLGYDVHDREEKERYAKIVVTVEDYLKHARLEKTFYNLAREVLAKDIQAERELSPELQHWERLTTREGMGGMVERARTRPVVRSEQRKGLFRLMRDDLTRSIKNGWDRMRKHPKIAITIAVVSGLGVYGMFHPEYFDKIFH